MTLARAAWLLPIAVAAACGPAPPGADAEGAAGASTSAVDDSSTSTTTTTTTTTTAADSAESSGDGTTGSLEPCPAATAGPTPTLHWSLHWRADDAEGRWDQASAVAVAPDGSLVVVGETRPMNGTDDESDAVILAIAPDGALLWSELYQGDGHFGDSATGVAMADDGTFYVTVIEQTAVVHGVEYPQIDLVVVLLAFAADGAHRWRREVEPYPYPASESVFRARPVALPQGQIVVAIRHSVEPNDSPGILLVNIDAWGNEQTRTLHDPGLEHDDLVAAFALDGGMGLVATEFVGDFAHVASFAADLSPRWSTTFELPDLYVGGGAATPSGGIVVAGGYRPDNEGPDHAIVQQWRSDGTLEWTLDEPEDAPIRAVAVDCAGTIAAAAELGDYAVGTQRTRLFDAAGGLLGEHVWSSGQDFLATGVRDVAMDPSGAVVVVGMDHQDATQYDLWVERLVR